MKRKILKAISIVMLISVIASIFAFDLSVKAEYEEILVDNIYYSIQDGEASVTGCYNLFCDELIISDTVKGCPVTTITRYAFQYGKFKRIVLSKNLKTIEGGAFYNCYQLNSITLPDSLEKLGKEVFRGCENLKEINIPKNLYFNLGIYDLPFYDSSLEKINIDDNNPYYKSIDGIVYNKQGTDLLYFPPCGPKKFSVPKFVSTIGPEAFEFSKIEEVYIPDNVTDIQYCAFASCYFLTKVRLSENITRIASNLFCCCPQLLEIKIPNKVEKIEDFAFGWCGVTELTIPSSVTELGNAVFSQTNIKNLTIPKTVQKIGDDLLEYSSVEKVNINAPVEELSGTFYQCKKLKSVSLPKTLTKIGENCFYNCTSLENFIVPDSVTTIGYKAFAERYESDLKIVIPDSVTYMEYNCFDCCRSLLIYGSKGSYAEQYARTNNLPFKYYKSLTKQSKINGYNYLLYGSSKSVNPTCKIESNALKASYKNCYDINTNVLLIDNEEKTNITLVPTSTNSFISGVYAKGADALSNPITVYESENTFNITVLKSNSFKVKKYQLMHNVKVIDENTSGIFTFDTKKYQPDSDYYVRLIGDDNKTYSKLKLSITLEKDVNIDVDLGDLCAFEIPENVPIIGGKDLKLSLSGVPFGINVEDDCTQIVFGNSYDYVKKEYGFSGFKNMVDKVNDDIADGKEFSNKNSEKFIDKNGEKVPQKGSFACNLKVCGYAEVRNINGKLQVGGKVLVSIEGSWKNEWQCFVLSVPVVLKASGTIGATVTGTVGIDSNNATYFNSDLNLTLPRITVSGGVGVKKIADLSVYGSGSNNIYINSKGPYVTATLSGEIGLSAKMLLLSAKMKILSGSLEYYNSLKYNNKSVDTAFFSNSQTYAFLQNEESYSIDRSHLSSQSEWLSTPKNQNLKARSFYSISETSETNLLQSDIYSNAKPQITKLNDGRKIMVWTADIADRTDYNHTAAVYSIYQPTTSSWSAPAIISDDGTADFDVKIASDGAKTFVVWTNSNITFTGDPSMAELASHCEIATAEFNSETEKFSSQINLTSDNYYDYSPNITILNGTGYISWAKNSDNAPLEMSGTNTLSYSVLGENTVHKITVSDKPINDYSIGLLDGKVTYAYTIDTDGDLTTVNDIQLFVGALGNNPTAIGTFCEQGNLAFANIGGTDSLLYYKNGNLCSRNSLDTDEQTLISGLGSNDFEIVQGYGKTSVLCSIKDTETDVDKANLYAYLYNGNGFAKPVCISKTDNAYISGTNGYMDEFGNICAVYTKNIISFSNDDFVESTSLYDVKIVPNFDLTITDINYSDNGIQTGEAMPITVTVKNNGLYNIDGFNISITDNQGNVILTKTINELLNVGETKEIVVEMLMPDISDVENYNLTILPLNGKDLEQSDNTSVLKIGYTDLSLSVKKIVSGNSTSALITVKNNGRKKQKTNLYIYDGDESGKLLGVYLLGDIEAGTSVDYKFDNEYFNQLKAENDVLYFEIKTDGEEYFTNDNFDSLAFKVKMLTLSDGTKIESYYDVNGDGEFNIIDLIRLKKMLSDTENPENDAFDLDGDLEINSTDLVEIKKKLLNIYNCF